ncbi:MAG: hypothetical protein D6713_09755 [Deltaproteobacteria bacterium]|nr:MAG: hypothetical protein D6713_09755 [Deltaproteobacteria bacterium]
MRSSPRYRAALFLGAALLVILLSAPRHAKSGEKTLEGFVVQVVDGDTILVSLSGRRVPVRLIGIDCPETGKNGAPSEFMADEARDFVREQVEGKRVTLTFDLEREDRYGRLLAYVYTPSGDCLNALLLKEGLALTMERFSFSRKKEFRALQEEARRKGKGLFSRSGIDAFAYTAKKFSPLSIYPGPARTWFIRWGNLLLPFADGKSLAEEIERVRRYRREYGVKAEEALLNEGYIRLGKSDKAKVQTSERVISYREAWDHVGEEVVVEGVIVRTKKTDRVIFLDFDEDWKHNLSVVIFQRSWKRFPSSPDRLFMGKKVRVKGKVKLYRGKPEIIVSDPDQISLSP